MTALATRIDNQDVAGWADRITACWRQSLDGIFATGRLLAEAKAALPHGEFRAMCADRLPFKPRMVQMLMAIAQDQRLSNAQYVAHLPPSWGTLYDLTRLDDAALDARIADGTINPAMERHDIGNAVKKQVRSTRELLLSVKQRALPSKKYGVIYADPAWQFGPYSRDTGMARAADNHYPTMTLAEIMRLNVDGIAADDCVLFMWTTGAMLIEALYVAEAWGFLDLGDRAERRALMTREDIDWARFQVGDPNRRYKSQQIWQKIYSGNMLGTGYWFRNEHEPLLVFTRGAIPAPAHGTQFRSVIEEAVSDHSAKPDKFYEIIEAYFPNVPKIELNARRARDGWDAWGLESPTQAEASPTHAAGQPITHDEETGEVV